MGIADRLKTYRREHGLTQGDVAKLIDCTAACVSRWESGGAILGLSRIAVETLLAIDHPHDILEHHELNVMRHRIETLEADNARLAAEAQRMREALKAVSLIISNV